MSQAIAFNGTTEFASVALTLLGVNKFSISCWVNWTTNANDDHLLAEYSTNYNSASGGFILNWDNSGVAGTFTVGSHYAGGYGAADRFTRPSAGVWHHLLFVFDLTNVNNVCSAIYVDGVSQSLTGVGGATGSLGNFTLYLMSRAGSSLFAAGAMAQLAMWSGTLLASADAVALAAGTDPRNVGGGATYFWRMDTLASEANLGSGGAAALTTNAASLTAGPAQLDGPELTGTPIYRIRQPAWR